MFDIAPSEFLLVAVVALVVIGPKDLPKALRVLGYWVGKARGVARQFRSGFDNMVREAELAEMEKKWAAENARIMAEHGAGEVADVAPAPHPVPGKAAPSGDEAPPHDGSPDPGEPITVEQPQLVPAPAGTPAHRPDDAMS
ncbi:Sec-independent protein translocase protein TatB [Sphingomonas bacterium]|uniref:Sec-independent protein translocase protein TatB n=1 Tax=Sphingomonas bacterium TaxID=1895847 RepID=UPI001575F83E|nr:Sec-independent protein translocase protein TatB [Sphingomonas bacterium]